MIPAALSPCACGGDVNHLDVERGYVHCTSCAARTHRSSQVEAIEAWNRGEREGASPAENPKLVVVEGLLLPAKTWRTIVAIGDPNPADTIARIVEERLAESRAARQLLRRYSKRRSA